mgnify:CR=1 FL=1
MNDYFQPDLTEDQLRAISSIGLAHMGDAVFEILVRTWLCAHGKATGKGLHQATVALVRAESQAERAERILPLLTEEEQAALAKLVPTIMAGGADQDTAQLIALVALKTSPTDPASGIDNAVSLVQDGAYMQDMQQAITQDPNAAETIAAAAAMPITCPRRRKPAASAPR